MKHGDTNEREINLRNKSWITKNEDNCIKKPRERKYRILKIKLQI